MIPAILHPTHEYRFAIIIGSPKLPAHMGSFQILDKPRHDILSTVKTNKNSDQPEHVSC
jgi:hypothetical protein